MFTLKARSKDNVVPSKDNVDRSKVNVDLSKDCNKDKAMDRVVNKPSESLRLFVLWI